MFLGYYYLIIILVLKDEIFVRSQLEIEYKKNKIFPS